MKIFLNQETRITKRGFELTIPQTGSSNRRGEIRMGWDITERIEEFFLFLPKRLLFSNEIKLWIASSRSQFVRGPVPVPVQGMIALVTRESL